MRGAAWKLAPKGQEVLGQPGVKRPTPAAPARDVQAFPLAAPLEVTLATRAGELAGVGAPPGQA